MKYILLVIWLCFWWFKLIIIDIFYLIWTFRLYHIFSCKVYDDNFEDKEFDEGEGVGYYSNPYTAVYHYCFK